MAQDSKDAKPTKHNDSQDEKPTLRLPMSDRRIISALTRPGGQENKLTRPLSDGPNAQNVEPAAPEPNTPAGAVSPSSEAAQTLPIPPQAETIDSTLLLSAGESAKADPPAEAAVSGQVITCPKCGRVARPGELICGRCGHVLANDGRTTKLDEEEQPRERRTLSPGEAISEAKPIVFEIDHQQLQIQVVDKVVIGRGGDAPASTGAPDIDLTDFNASELGVSRRHLRIRRNGALLYVADLHSTNGTLLNGRRLIPEGERLLRSGDELRLGHLRLRVRF